MRAVIPGRRIQVWWLTRTENPGSGKNPDGESACTRIESPGNRGGADGESGQYPDGESGAVESLSRRSVRQREQYPESYPRARTGQRIVENSAGSDVNDHGNGPRRARTCRRRPMGLGWAMGLARYEGLDGNDNGRDGNGNEEIGLGEQLRTSILPGGGGTDGERGGEGAQRGRAGAGAGSVGAVGVGADAVGLAEVRQGTRGHSRAVFQRSGLLRISYVMSPVNSAQRGSERAQRSSAFSAAEGRSRRG